MPVTGVQTCALPIFFSSVVVSRAVVNLVYGHRRKVEKLHIGNTAWK